MIAFRSSGRKVKTNGPIHGFRVPVMIFLILLVFCVHAASQDTVSPPPTTTTAKLENKNSVLSDLNRGISRMLPPSLASEFNYLVRLMHRRSIVPVLFILIICFFLQGLFIAIDLFISKIRGNYREKKQKRYELKYHDLIATFLFQESDDLSIPVLLTRQHSKFKKNILINLIVKLYIDLEGDVAQRLRFLYLQLHLDRVSMQKIRRGTWYVKIQGFRELANMDVGETISLIRRYINHPNDELRSEAMISIVRLDKENPFGFLDELTTPFTKWEQMNVFSMARKYQVSIPAFKKWLNHENTFVVSFALTMIGIYQQLDATEDIIRLLNHPAPAIRKLAIKLTGEFGMFNHESLLRSLYPNESAENQLEIIKALSKIPDASQLNFFSEILLKSSSFPLRFAASRTLLEQGMEGIAAFELVRRENRQDLDPIYHHINDKRI